MLIFKYFKSKLRNIEGINIKKISKQLFFLNTNSTSLYNQKRKSSSIVKMTYVAYYIDFFRKPRVDSGSDLTVNLQTYKYT